MSYLQGSGSVTPQFLAGQGIELSMNNTGSWIEISSTTQEEIDECRKRVDRIEKLLGLPDRNETLELSYERLKKLGDQMDSSIIKAFEKISQASAEYKAYEDELKILEKLKKD